MIALVVNPFAGIGGPAGMKGSDDPARRVTAAELGYLSHATERATRALQVFGARSVTTGSGPRGGRARTVLTAVGAMGEDAVRAADLTPQIVYDVGTRSTAEDTTGAVAAAARAGAKLILVVGGDGTVCDASRGLETIPPAERPAILGVPAGVKMYSGCFAVSPAAAGTLAADWLAVAVPRPTEDADVLDVDESLLGTRRAAPALHAVVSVPVSPTHRTQGRKSPSPPTEAAAVRAAASGGAAELRPGVTYLLGPGSTMAQLARILGIEATPLGVDLVRDGRLIHADVSEKDILSEVRDPGSKAVVTVIGGQGFLLGRGNQQFSPAVLRALGPDPLLVVATEEKLLALAGRPLLVDTGDPVLDRSLEGYVRVITAPGASTVYPVRAPDAG